MKIKKTLFVQATKYSFESDFSISVNAFQAKTERDQVVIDICQHEIELDVPDMDENSLTLAHIEQLQKMRVQVLADNHIRLQKLDEQIASLQAIEHKPALAA
jgi:hypothetical protein